MATQSLSTEALISHVSHRLIVRQLQHVLRSTGLPSSGVKKALQERLIDRILELSRNDESEALDKLRNLIYRTDSAMPAVAGSSVGSRPNDFSSSPTTNGGYDRIHFKPSPFYEILESLCPFHSIPVMNHHRNTVKATVILNQAQLTSLSQKNVKAMLYCGALDAPALTPMTKLDIGFPAQVEVKVNEQAIPASQLRGLKNKPGSTRPPDITALLVKSIGATNNISITYALTQKKYAFVINMVSVISVGKLVQDLRKSNNRISKQTVINEVVKRNEDSDLMATSSVMSLKCPLSTLRIDLPVRSRVCTHVQCFDASSYLQLQQQAPTWSCPTCSKPVPYDMLVVDSYVQDILDSTPKSVDSVTVDPHGNWSVASQRSPSAEPGANTDDDEDIIEIQDSRSTKRVESINIVTPARSREDTVPRSSSKRPISQVIDLTLSDDDEPARPAKRTVGQFFQTPSSLTSSEPGRVFPRSPIVFPIPRLTGPSTPDSLSH